MADSTSAGDIPLSFELVAGYVDGTYRWSDEDWARFPASVVKVRIAALPTTDDGEVLDVEKGDAIPEEAPPWVLMRRAAGGDPTVYVGEYQWPEVRAAFADAGVAEPHYWIAHYGIPPIIPDGAVALQYANAPLTGGHYDESVVADYWPGVDKEADVTGDQVKDLIREMLGSPEGAALVKTAITAPGGYGEALEGELDMRETRTVLETLLQVQASALKPKP